MKDETIFPSSCIVLTGDDASLTKRVRDLPESAVTGTHYTKEDMVRRLQAYRTANNSTVAEPAVQDFFKKQGISVCTEKIDTEERHALNGFKIYIERNEKPFNYMTYDEEEESKRFGEYEASLSAKLLQKMAGLKQEENLERVVR